MKKFKKPIIIVAVLAVALAWVLIENGGFKLNVNEGHAGFTDVAKGQFGRAIPIADNNHPNLYYNQSEVDEMRNMILVQQSPSILVNIYNSTIKNSIAAPAVVDEYDTNNMEASMNYMIEPTSAKADAIKTSLMSYKALWPDGISDWASAGGCHACGYFLPWMFDLLQAYNPEKLSSNEKTDLKNWFKVSAERLEFGAYSKDECMIAQDFNQCKAGVQIVPPPYNREGKIMDGWPNWYGRYMGPALAAGLVSGNQAAVDYWADSGWPHDLFTFDGLSQTSQWPSNTANRYDLVMYLESVYPSGANTDTYDREGYNNATHTWNTTSYISEPADGGAYHNAQMFGAIMGAEMAYHNGMTGVYGVTDVPGTEPALLRTYKRSIASRYENDSRGTSKTGHPFLWHDPIIMFGYRHYSDPAIDNVVPLLSVDNPCGMQCGPDISPDANLYKFFGYPRRIAWTAGSGTPPPPPAPNPPPPPPPSSSGTRIPTAANITDNGGAVWTLVANSNCSSPYKEILRNGSRPYSSFPTCGKQILWYQNILYIEGDDLGWYRWTGSTWSYLSTVDPNPTATPLVGDVNLDHIVNTVDWSIINSKWFTNDATADLNKDGIVNTIDFSLLNANWFKTW